MRIELRFKDGTVEEVEAGREPRTYLEVTRAQPPRADARLDSFDHLETLDPQDCYALRHIFKLETIAGRLVYLET